jgi:hypothetical protein
MNGRRGKTGTRMMFASENHFRFAPGRSVFSPLDERIAEVRQLLRTNMSFKEITDRLGVSDTSLRAFIKRRQLCDLKERKQFIGRFKLVHQQKDNGREGA